MAAPPDDLAHARVDLWGRTVGAVVETGAGRIIFEYAPEFRRSGLEVSPVHLPLHREGPQTFDELRRKPAFDGLPGVLADALPDSFGNRVIRAYFAARGREEAALSPVQKLLYVGERALGALTFHPAERFPTRPAELESLEIAALVQSARAIVEGDSEVAVPEIYRVGSSAGGMRPKAVVLHDPATGTIRSGHATPREGEVACILKFDGVGQGADGDVLGPAQPFNRIEAAYSRLAAAAGIDMASINVLEAGEHAHLLIRRFDLRDGQRLHQHTLGGLLHVDYNDPGASSYEEYLRTILRLGLPPAAVQEGFRRMVFNVLAVNQDDHVKNLSFHMNPDGRWHLTPAYDVTFARGRGFTARHQMSVADKVEGITRPDLLSVARAFAIRRAGRLIEKVEHALSGFTAVARALDAPGDTISRVAAELEKRRAQLAD